MIRTERLMRFDWVYNAERRAREQVVCINSIRVMTTSREKYVNIRDIEPIRINAEILTDNDFKLTDNGYIWGNVCVSSVVDSRWHNDGWDVRVDAYNARVFVHIDFIHELQHVLRLIDCEQKANDFKVKQI